LHIEDHFQEACVSSWAPIGSSQMRRTIEVKRKLVQGGAVRNKSELESVLAMAMQR
jgi:hypothetical protein